MNKFDATDCESALRFSENGLVLEKSSFEILNNYWLLDVILTSFRIPSHGYQILRQVLRLSCNYELTWDMNKHFIQGLPINRYAESSCGWGVWRLTLPYMVISPIWKIKYDFFDNTTTFKTLTAQILVLRARGQLGYLNSNVMLR